MIESEKVKKILYGGDYNPEQWPEDVWEEDMRLFKLAHIDTVTLNVFSWAALQPDDDTYDFSKLDRIMETAKNNGLNVVLATSTAAHPAWMARKHPDILRTDFYGRKRKFGFRHNSCPNSPTYRKYAPALAGKLAERYRGYDNIVAWHISNEFGGECYCENCEKAFRDWLREKYGTIEKLNEAWDCAFWSHTMYDWDDIVLPNMLSEYFNEHSTVFQGIALDYKRFNSDSMLDCYRLERDAVKKHTPDIPVTTNLMGFYQPIDYQKWAKEMDFVSWDNYPEHDFRYTDVAMTHDLNRGLKSGKPFCLMEQTPSVSNWHPYNALKRPGVMRLLSYQAVAHGSDTVMFFQMRRSIGACEKYHGAVIDHAGHENTRVFREVAELGRELEAIGGQTLGARTRSDVAILFDWDNWWATSISAGPTRLLDYKKEAADLYKIINRKNITVDVIGMDEDFSKYRVLIAPVLYMTKGDVDERIRKFTAGGGTFVTTFFSGFTDERDIVITGGYPGRLSDILGIWVEEEDALPAGKTNSFTYGGKRYHASLLCDIIHTRGAESLCEYESDFYAGCPAVTKNNFGRGKAYYLGTKADDDFIDVLFGEIFREDGVEPVTSSDPGVEATVRENENGRFLFLLNHTEEEAFASVPADGTDILSGCVYRAGGRVTLSPKDVAIIRMQKKL